MRSYSILPKLSVLWLVVVVSVTMLACALWFPAQAMAEANKCPAPNVRNDVRPDVVGTPTQVDMGVRLIDLTGIDDVNQSMTVDFAVIMSWMDPRLAELNGCVVPLTSVWEPGIGVFNSGRLFRSEPEVVRISEGGQVTYSQRFFGTIATYHNLRNFPFDRQIFRISMYPFLHSEKEIVLKVNEQVTGVRNILNISSWNVERVRGVVDSLVIDAFDQNHSTYVFEVHASRITEYYIWKVILPLCLIVAMSWAVFWVNPAQFGPQIGLSATSMLTLIAFIFATTNMVPALGYFTIFDYFIVGSTVLVFLAFVESLTASFLVAKGKAKTAERIDGISRFAFPAVFIIFVAMVLS